MTENQTENPTRKFPAPTCEGRSPEPASRGSRGVRFVGKLFPAPTRDSEDRDFPTFPGGRDVGIESETVLQTTTTGIRREIPAAPVTMSP